MTARFRLAFRALRHRDLRLFFAGQAVSLVGTWMQQVAMSWLVYRLTGSALLLGVISFSSQFPSFLMAPFAGALADRWSRYRMVVVAQTLSMIQATVLAVLVITDVVTVTHLIVLSVMIGLINGVDVPARQALMIRLVRGADDLPNAIALNSSMFNAARLVGPALAGVLIGLVGEGPVFVLNAASYIAVLWALAQLRVSRQPGQPVGSVLRSMVEGFSYAVRSPPIRDLLILLSGISLVGVPYVVLFPVFARDVLGGGAGTLGLLTSSAGLGSLAGALALASRSTVRGLGPVLAWGIVAFGASLMGFAFSRTLPLSCALLVVSGFAMIVVTASTNTILQTIVSEEMRGRIMSLYTMAFVGMTPLGGLAGGAIASRVGAPTAVVLGGAGCMALAAWTFWRLPALRSLIRPIYAELGIIPEVATGLQSVSEMRPRA
ncbi:MAG: MFS transporter [Gemmatimonadota bacterium]|nr:MFS transporter [Gemmatimonadota bacterium]